MAVLRGVLVALVTAGAPAARPAAVPEDAPLPPPPCAITKPDGKGSPVLNDPDRGGYGNEALWTNLWMWGEDGVPVPPSHANPDRSFGPMKWAWYRHVRGRLSVDGRRLDAPAPALRVDVPEGYGDGGFQPVGITFPTEGCWQVTGRVGDASLTFVTRVAPADAFETPAASA